MLNSRNWSAELNAFNYGNITVRHTARHKTQQQHFAFFLLQFVAVRTYQLYVCYVSAFDVCCSEFASGVGSLSVAVIASLLFIAIPR